MTWLASLLVGSRLGRYAALAGVVLAIAAVAALWLVSVGRQRERAAAAARSLDVLRKRIATDDDLARLSPAERRRRLSRDWGVP